MKITPVFDKARMEVDLAPWSGLTPKEVENKFPDAYQTWQRNPIELILTKKDGTQYSPIKELFVTIFLPCNGNIVRC